MEYILLIIAAVLVNNIVLTQFLGICPFLGVSKSIDTALGMGGAVIFVMVLATMVTGLVDGYVLLPLGLSYLRTVTFILVIAALVQMVEIILKKVAPPLYQALGIFLPLITTNCAVLGIAILSVQKDFPIIKGVVYAAANAIGFTFALVLFAGIREQLELANIPKGLRGFPIALITAGLMSLAFMGFAGIV
jgi:electron transport complex protein RnfA